IEERAKLVADLHLEGINVRAPLGMPVLDRILKTLYAAPSMVTILPIQDLFGWSARINRPGTVSESNWTYRLPVGFERMTSGHAIGASMRELREIAIESGRFEEKEVPLPQAAERGT